MRDVSFGACLLGYSYVLEDYRNQEAPGSEHILQRIVFWPSLYLNPQSCA